MTPLEGLPLYNGVAGGDHVSRPWIVGGLSLVGVLLTGAGLALLSLPAALLTLGGICLAGALLAHFLSSRAAASASTAPAPSELPPVPGPDRAAVPEPALSILPPEPAPADSLPDQQYAGPAAAAVSEAAAAEALAVGSAAHGSERAEAVRDAAPEEAEPPETPAESREKPPAPARKVRMVTASAATYQEGGLTAKHELRLRIGGRRRT